MHLGNLQRSAAAIRNVYDNWKGGDADQLQAGITALRKAIQAFPMIPALKALVAHYRKDPGWCQDAAEPFTELPAADAEKLIKHWPTPTTSGSSSPRRPSMALKNLSSSGNSDCLRDRVGKSIALPRCRPTTRRLNKARRAVEMGQKGRDRSRRRGFDDDHGGSDSEWTDQRPQQSARIRTARKRGPERAGH